MSNNKSVNEADEAERNKRIWDLRLVGKSQAAIAVEVGLSQQHVSRILSDMAKAYPSESVEAYFLMQLDRVEKVVEATWRIAQAEYYAHGNGRLIRNEEGNPIVDTAPNVAAYKTYMDALKELNKLRGLYAPEKREVTARMEVTPDIMDLIHEVKDKDNASED